LPAFLVKEQQKLKVRGVLCKDSLEETKTATKCHGYLLDSGRSFKFWGVIRGSEQEGISTTVFLYRHWLYCI
jgi:hypothetical protein